MSYRKIFTIALTIVISLTGCVQLPERTIHEVPETVTSYSAGQMYLTLAGRKNEMKNVYTDKIFDVAVNDAGQRYSDTFNDTVCDYLEKVQVMSEMCEERAINLSMIETKEIETAVESFLEEFATCGNSYEITEEEVREMLTDLKKIELLRELIIEEADVEVSESDARVMDVERIMMNTSEKANEVMDKITNNPDVEFFTIARRNSDDAEILLSVGRGDLGDVIDEVIFNLNDGEVSPVIPCGGKYYIFRCVSGYNEEATAVRKEKMTQERQSRAVGMKYEEYLEEHPFEMDEEAWKTAVQMCNDNPVVPDIYETIKKD